MRIEDKMQNIHPTAIIESGANIEDDVEIGPYCLIGAQVKLGSHNKLHSHVVIEGNTQIGEGNEFFPFSSIGKRPQDLKFHDENSQVIIGDHNTFREGVSVNKGTEGGGMITQIANHCLFMTGSHVAHDCKIGEHVIAANNVAFGGHVQVEDYAIIGGNSAIHQFTRVGQHSLISGVLGVNKDILPYTVVTAASRGRIRTMGINIIGLKRRDFAAKDIRLLLKFYHEILENTEIVLEKKIQASRRPSYRHCILIQQIANFISTQAKRPLCLPLDAESQEYVLNS